MAPFITSVMKLYIKLLTGDFLQIDCDPNEKSIHDAIHMIHPEWDPSQMRLFTMDAHDGICNMSTLEENNILCLFICDPCYVRILTNAEHLIFSLSVSERPDFTYPCTRSLFFEFSGHKMYDYSKRHAVDTLEHLIHRSDEFRMDQLEYIIKEAQKQWAVIMETYEEKRGEYLRRLQIVQSVDN